MATGGWGWSRQPPRSRAGSKRSAATIAVSQATADHARALDQFACQLCNQTARQPMSTPCAHIFCKPCLFQRVSRSCARRIARLRLRLERGVGCLIRSLAPSLEGGPRRNWAADGMHS